MNEPAIRQTLPSSFNQTSSAADNTIVCPVRELPCNNEALMNPILAGFAIPNILPAARIAVAAVQAAASPFAETLELALGRSREVHPGTQGDESSWAELQTIQRSMKEDLQQRMAQAFSRAGIRLDEKIQLRLHPDDGTVEVLGDHPNRIALEAIFAENPEFGDTLRHLATLDQLHQTSDGQTRIEGPLKMSVMPHSTAGGVLIEIGE
jgi:hypothetical protein